MRGSREISLVPSLHRASTDSLLPTNFALQLIKKSYSLINPPPPPSCPFFLHIPSSCRTSPALPLSDGVGRTGTFICLHSQLERLKTEGVVDFPPGCQASRIQRPGLVPDAVCSFSLHSLLTGRHTLALSLVLKTYSTLKQSAWVTKFGA